MSDADHDGANKKNIGKKCPETCFEIVAESPSLHLILTSQLRQF